MLAEQGFDTALGDLPALDVAAPLGAHGNPVRVDGPSGEHEYLARLRCLEGNAPKFERLGSVGEGPYGSILDVYDLRCMDGDRSAQCSGLPPTGPGNHRSDVPKAGHALTFKLDQSIGADQVVAYIDRL